MKTVAYPRRTDGDRRTRQSERLARVLRVLQLIQGRGRWNAVAIAEELNCSERTVFRDLQVLRFAGIPWELDEKQGHYHVRPDFRFPVLNLTEEELLGQVMATVLTSGPALRAGMGAKPATEKLAAVSSDAAQKILTDAARLVTVLNLQLADHERHQEIIRTAQWALIQRKRLLGHYQSPYQAKPVTLRLHPYRLCLVKQAWYLIARLTDESGPKTYRIARFKMLRMVDCPADVPTDFDVREYFGNAWGVYRGTDRHEVEIEFTREAAPLVVETIWHHTQKVRKHKDGKVTMSYQVDGLREILWWVLGWSGRAKVLAPQELIELVNEKLREAVEMNERKSEARNCSNLSV